MLVRGADLGNADAVSHAARYMRAQALVQERLPWVSGAAAALAVPRPSALRLSRGTAFSGSSRFSRFATPALSRKAHHAIRTPRALLHPVLDLVHAELEPVFLVLRQQRIEVAEALDETAVPGGLAPSATM